jgi:hypothetical protein
MPLDKSGNKASVGNNIRTEMDAGKPQKQAVAIALDVARRAKRKDGGAVHVGPIDSNVPGRTDEHEMNVEDGSYVLPSETISHLGQNNTEAGFEVAKRMFPDSARRTIKIKRAKGGAVPVVTAGGEFVVSRKDAERIGGGDLDHGHKILDHFVMMQRKKHIETLKGLDGPAQD